jgi:hypothetical protein
MGAMTCWYTTPKVSAAWELLDAFAELDVEGIVAKWVEKRYRQRIRSGD